VSKLPTSNQKPEHVVKQEFERSTEKIQVITACLGIRFNFFWVISDYFVIPENLWSFFAFRLLVAVVA
jgi:hypothetical protein